MAVIETLRFLLKKYTAGEDPHPTRVEFNDMIDSVENNAVMGAQGITSARPAAGKGLRFFWDETAQRQYYDDGTNWKDLNPNGGGGPGSVIVPGAAPVEGASNRSARADHSHLLPLATGTAAGALSATDKAKLDAATAGATANTLAQRDASGRLSVNTPTSAGHAATKAYTDGLSTANADYTDQQVGPGLTVHSWPLGALSGFTVTGKIESVPFANKTLVTGNVTIKRPDGSTNYTVPGGGTTSMVSLGALIPTEIREASSQPTDKITMLRGGAAEQAIQTAVEPSTGRVMVRADDAAGTSWVPNAQLSVNFSYYVQTVIV